MYTGPDDGPTTETGTDVGPMTAVAPAEPPPAMEFATAEPLLDPITDTGCKEGPTIVTGPLEGAAT